MTKFIRITILSAVGIVVLAFLIKISPFGKELKPSFPVFQNLTPSPDILYLTPAIKSFNGSIEKIDGSTILVSKEVKIESLTNSPAKKISYKVTLTKNTKINRFFSTSADKNLKVGDQITALTDSDLRMLSKAEFQATTINVLPKITSLNGTITAINGNTLTVKGTAIIPPVPELFVNGPAQEKDYDVSLTKETEISRLTAGTNPLAPSRVEKLTASDLKKGMAVTVYSNSAVSSTSRFQAKKIEVGGILPPAIP